MVSKWWLARAKAEARGPPTLSADDNLNESDIRAFLRAGYVTLRVVFAMVGKLCITASFAMIYV